MVFPLPSLKLPVPAENEQDEQATQKINTLIPLEEFAQQKIKRGQFAALMWENRDGKTPLHIAIENNHTS